MLTCHWPPVRSLRPPKMNIKDPWGRKSRKWWEIMVPLPNCLTYGSCWVEVPVHWGLTNTGLRNRRIEARILVWLKRKFTSSFQVMFVRSSLYTSCPNLNKVYSFNVSTIHYSHLELGHGYLHSEATSCDCLKPFNYLLVATEYIHVVIWVRGERVILGATTPTFS